MQNFVSISHRYGSTVEVYQKALFGGKCFNLSQVRFNEHTLQEVLRYEKVSISHRYGSTCIFNLPFYLSNSFQSLIGTVQQQYLLRFLFSLYPISPVFQPFSPKKSVNLFIVNSRKALILLAFLFLSKLARRFTDFLTVFFCFQHLFMLFLSWRP